MGYHTVLQGEHLSGIARQYGFWSGKLIWDHPQNAELKKLRQNPNVIFPGDSVFIPEKRPRTEIRSAGKAYRFELKTETILLRLVLEDLFEKPIANATCELRVEDDVFPLTTDGTGRIEQEIEWDARTALLTIKDPSTPINEILIPIRIGELDPVNEESGQRARLNNLGYFAGPLDEKTPATRDDAARFLSAVEEFQCDHGLVVDGKCGPTTQARLRQLHGC